MRAEGQLISPSNQPINIRTKATNVFYRNMGCKNRIIVNRGGARSSKSWSIAQLFLYKFLMETRKKFLVVRKTLPACRISTYLLIKEQMEEMGITQWILEEKQARIFHYARNLLHWTSIDDPEKIKSTEWNYIWMEEANEFTYDDFMILKLRMSGPTEDGKPNQMFMSFNPVDEHLWIKGKVVEKEKEVKEILSTYTDNPFLAREYVESLEDLKNQDMNYYRIYALNEWGHLENLIYSNYKMADELPDGGETIYGLDFGFNNPTALVKIVIKDQEIWEKQLLYKTGLTNTDLIDWLTKLVEKRIDCIYADSEEPARIEEIKRAGFNVHPSVKGKGSVKDGIDFVKRQKIHITKDSPDLLKEKRNYVWKQDKDGNVLDEPVKFYDHLLDGERYAIHAHMGKPKLRVTVI